MNKLIFLDKLGCTSEYPIQAWIFSRFAPILAVVMMTLMCSCNGGNKFKVSGTVDGAGDTTVLYLETNLNGMWYPIDSVSTDGDKFSFKADAIDYPNIYRLVHGEDAIYFPIDSIDNLEINTDIKNFAENYTISGSVDAERMMKFDKELAKFVKAGDFSSEAFKKWKEATSRELVSDAKSIVSYYIVNKYIGTKPLYDPEDNSDFKIIGAVTNAFSAYRPNDPRTPYLIEAYKDKLRIRRAANGNIARDTIQAPQTGILDFSLSDKMGKLQSFKEVCSQGKVVILNFTIQNESFSPSLNKLLNDVYNKYHSKGLEIYQVSFDDDETTWRRAVARLPWIVTRDSNGVVTALLYNVTEIPMIYLINRKGDIVGRVENIDLLEDTLKKYL